MPLDKSGLASDLESFFADSPFGESDCAQKWADAMFAYASAVVPPADPAKLQLAATALAGALSGFSASAAAAGLLETAFTTFGAAVGLAIAQVPPVFVSKPPTAKVGFADVWASTFTSAGDAADALAGKIDTWMKTGQSAPTPPGTVFTPWS